MKLENMFKKTRTASGKKSYISLREKRPEVPEGLLRKCNKCGSAIIAEDVKRGYYICPKCGGYFRVHAYRRIEMIADAGTFEEWDKDLIGGNPIDYKGYPEKMKAVQEKTNLREAVVTGKAKIEGTDAVIDLCFCGMNRISEKGSRFYFPVHPFRVGHELEAFLAENRAGTQTMLMYRHVWERLQFDETIKRYQDWDFGIRAAKQFVLCYLPEALVESKVGEDSISARVTSYPHLRRLYDKHALLYRQYPASDAVMNRRLGKRVHAADPALAAEHFRKSFALSHSFYDLGYWTADRIRSAMKERGRKREG